MMASKLSNSTLFLIANEALVRTATTHRKLGASGLEYKSQNRFSESSLVGDWQAEEDVIATLKKYNVPVRLVTEEHGDAYGAVKIGQARMTGMVDGLDGSGNFVDYQNWKLGREGGRRDAEYGTMFALYNGLTPIYDEGVTAGIMMHPLSSLLVWGRESGCWVKNPHTNTNERVKAATSGRTVFDENTRVIINSYPNNRESYGLMLERLFARNLPSGMAWKSMGSTAAHYYHLATGSVDIVIEATRKQNLELAVGYPIINALGGTIVTEDGRSIGWHSYEKWGQDPTMPIPTIAAATPELAKSFLDYLSSRHIRPV